MIYEYIYKCIYAEQEKETESKRMLEVLKSL